MSQEALAKAVGLKKAMISGVETGKFWCSAPDLIKIGKVLLTGVDALAYAPSVSATLQPPLPGMGWDERINALPEAFREAAILTIKDLEVKAQSVPAEFLKPPTGETLNDFMQLLDQLPKNPPSPSGEA